MSDSKPRNSRKILKWAVVLIVGLPLLFLLFEFVVPRLLPANF